MREDFSKNLADQQRLQISDPHFDKLPTPVTFACRKTRFKIEDCTCSQFLTEAMQWIKEVEMVDSVDELRSSSSTEQKQDQRFQSGPSAKDSVIFSGGDSSKNHGADQQRLQISDLHFDKFPTPATFACWKIRFKTEVCTCSQFPRKPCCGPKKWRWSNQWMISNLRVL